MKFKMVSGTTVSKFKYLTINLTKYIKVTTVKEKEREKGREISKHQNKWGNVLSLQIGRKCLKISIFLNENF